MLKIDRHGSVGRIDKPDASIEKIHSTAALPAGMSQRGYPPYSGYLPMLGAATEIFKMEVPAAGKSAVPTGPTKPLGKKTSQARRSQFNGSIRVLSSPANSEVVRDGIEKRGDCVATERSGLPANKVSGIPDAGSGWVAGRDGCCLSKKKRGRLVLVATLVAIRVCVIARVLPSAGLRWWVTRLRWLPGGVHGHGLQVHHSDRRVRRVHRGRGACLRLCRRVRPVRRGVRDRHGRQVRLQAGLG